MDFCIQRNDDGNFRNFIVIVQGRLLIGRNEDFLCELGEWADGVLSLMRNGSSYFSPQVGFAPFVGTISKDMVEFETMDNEKVRVNFFAVIRDTIVFLFEQAKEEIYHNRDNEFFEMKAMALLAGFRFRFKDRYDGFMEELRGKGLIEADEDSSVELSC